jgi:hypothetical protein
MRLLKIIVALVVLGVGTSASSMDVGPLRLSGHAQLLGDGTHDARYPFRLETNLTLRLRGIPLWFHHLWDFDHSSEFEDRVNSKLTVGVSVWRGFSLIYQRQEITNVPAANRIGIQFNLP